MAKLDAYLRSMEKFGAAGAVLVMEPDAGRAPVEVAQTGDTFLG